MYVVAEMQQLFKFVMFLSVDSFIVWSKKYQITIVTKDN